MTGDPMDEETTNASRSAGSVQRAMRRRFTSIGRLIAFTAGSACALGLGLRLTVRDAFAPLAVFYYALPLPVIAGLACLAAIPLRRTSRRLTARILWGIAALCAACGFYSGYSVHEESFPDASLDVLFWNTGRGARGWNEIAGELRRFDAPIIGLVEAGSNNAQMRRFWNREFPGRDVAVLGGGMVLLVRGRIVAKSTGTLGTDSDYAVVDVRLENRQLTVVLVDVVSTPWKSRKEPLEDLAALLETLRDRPVVVLGDFNTPPDSIHFSGIRRHCRSAFESAGNGYTGTWPVPAPVLSLDQIWANDRVSFHVCEHLWSARSDHRPVVATISIR